MPPQDPGKSGGCLAYSRPIMSKPIDRNISEALAKEQNDAKEKADKKKARRKGKQRATRLQSEQKAKR